LPLGIVRFYCEPGFHWCPQLRQVAITSPEPKRPPSSPTGPRRRQPAAARPDLYPFWPPDTCVDPHLGQATLPRSTGAASTAGPTSSSLSCSMGRSRWFPSSARPAASDRSWSCGGSGTGTMRPQLGHLPFFPACSSFARIWCRHRGHSKLMGMMSTSRTGAERGFRSAGTYISASQKYASPCSGRKESPIAARSQALMRELVRLARHAENPMFPFGSAKLKGAKQTLEVSGGCLRVSSYASKSTVVFPLLIPFSTAYQ